MKGQACTSAFFRLRSMRCPGIVFSVAVVSEPELASAFGMNYTLFQKKKKEAKRRL
jgi:hypothetical protein